MKKLSQHSHSALILTVAILVIGIASRLIPHPANMTPMISLSLIAATQLRKSFSLITIFFVMVISDFLLSQFLGFISSWSLFTYSGFLAIALIASFQKWTSGSSLILAALVGTLGFWIWTNFGVWLISDMYSHTSTGFIACYVAALPFLRNSLIGSLAWMLIYLSVFQYALSKQITLLTRSVA